MNKRIAAKTVHLDVIEPLQESVVVAAKLLEVNGAVKVDGFICQELTTEEAKRRLPTDGTYLFYYDTVQDVPCFLRRLTDVQYSRYTLTNGAPV